MPLNSSNGISTTVSLSGGSSTVVVADDNIDAADSLGLMLQLLGAEVSVAYDGPTAIERVVREQPEFEGWLRERLRQTREGGAREGGAREAGAREGDGS